MFEVKMKTFYKDGTEIETVASAQHFVDFEEHFDEPVLDSLKPGSKLTHLYYLSWLSSSASLEFKEWVKTVRDVDPVRADDVPPFGLTTSDAPSQS